MLGKEFRKIQPKLRMIAKAYDNVNAIRSDFASAIRIRPTKAEKLVPDTEQPRLSARVPDKKLKAPKLKSTSDSIEVNVFLSRYSSIPESKASRRKLRITSEIEDGSIATATLPLNGLAAVS